MRRDRRERAGEPLSRGVADAIPRGPCRAVVSSQLSGTLTIGETVMVVRSPLCRLAAATPVTKLVDGVNVGVPRAVHSSVRW